MVYLIYHARSVKITYLFFDGNRDAKNHTSSHIICPVDDALQLPLAASQNTPHAHRARADHTIPKWILDALKLLLDWGAGGSALFPRKNEGSRDVTRRWFFFRRRVGDNKTRPTGILDSHII